uniref:ELMO domain-containing protein n=1 Tax=Timema monikensis TaxID=170555 RepID=A0A7R9EE20_9NEOP|nr:unnamed protein product [Timema monikensis]
MTTLACPQAGFSPPRMGFRGNGGTNFQGKCGPAQVDAPHKRSSDAHVFPRPGSLTGDVKRVPGALRSLCELLKHVTSVHHSKDGGCKHLLSYSGRLVLCCMFQSNTRTSVERRGLCTLFSCLLGPPNLHEQLLAERDLVFAIAQCKLDLEDCVHYRMLQTVYQRLTGTRLDCTCYGSHWQQIGFQGNDPGTDLRGVGMFGLLQLLYLASSPHLMPLARDIYRVSLDEQQNFPLAVLSLNMTRMALQTLRQGLLNRECNERQMVVEVLNEFYAAIFCHTLHLWTSQHKTIRDSGYVLKGWYHSTTYPDYTHSITLMG